MNTKRGSPAALAASRRATEPRIFTRSISVHPRAEKSWAAWTSAIEASEHPRSRGDRSSELEAAIAGDPHDFKTASREYSREVRPDVSPRAGDAHSHESIPWSAIR